MNETLSILGTINIYFAHIISHEKYVYVRAQATERTHHSSQS